MKSFVLCAFVLILVSSSSAKLKEMLQSSPENAQADFQACNTDNVTIDDWYEDEDIISLIHVKPENIEKTRKIGCWIACALQKLNLMEGSNFNEEQFIEKLEILIAYPVKIREPVQKCLKEARIITQECEKSISLLTCLARKEHEVQRHEEHEREETEEKSKSE